jgi:hypothetical protein
MVGLDQRQFRDFSADFDLLVGGHSSARALIAERDYFVVASDDVLRGGDGLAEKRDHRIVVDERQTDLRLDGFVAKRRISSSSNICKQVWL